ncbi:Gfo/Idh/MocA family protein [Halopelagius longus]|nr:Gfo/Idh/MocA family oxidoreductase [Halopelagius longus]RDI71356.1 gfo/Idh/MocA family oxidoreductase [Halopelagius longus]
MEDDRSFTTPLQMGVIGLGYIGTTVGGEFDAHPDVSVTALCDVNESARKQGGETFHVPESSQYEDYQRMYDEEAELDAVLVGTPHTLHYEQVSAAFDAGLHVYCDKPMTTDLETARELYERSQESEEMLMVGYQRHLNPSFRSARKRWKGPDRWPNWLTAEVTQDWVDRFEGTWRQDPDLSGGGYLYDTGSHLLDAILWTTGLTPTAVSADMQFIDDEQRVDGVGSLRIKFEEGATATVSVNGDAPATREHIHVWDDEGAVYLEGREWEPRNLKTIDPDSTEHVPYVDFEKQHNRAADFLRALRDGTDPPATAHDGLRVTAVTEAAYESARADGEWVDIDIDSVAEATAETTPNSSDASDD